MYQLLEIATHVGRHFNTFYGFYLRTFDLYCLQSRLHCDNRKCNNVWNRERPTISFPFCYCISPFWFSMRLCFSCIIKCYVSDKPTAASSTKTKINIHDEVKLELRITRSGPDAQCTQSSSFRIFYMLLFPVTDSVILRSKGHCSVWSPSLQRKITQKHSNTRLQVARILYGFRINLFCIPFSFLNFQRQLENYLYLIQYGIAYNNT